MSGRAQRAQLKREILEPRQPTDRPLPGLAFPDAPAGVVPTWELRELALAAARNRVAARRLFRQQLQDYDKEAQPPYEHREIIVRFVLGRDGVAAVVDWRDGRVGRAGLLRRASGPLRIDGRTLRSCGPGVALLGLLRALAEATDT